MPDRVSLGLYVHGNADIVDALLSRADGGRKLTAGVAERARSRFPDVSLTVSYEPSAGFEALRAALEAGTSALLTAAPDIVALSIADDARALPHLGVAPEEAVHRVRDALVGVVRLIKQTIGAHVLVANASTFDPGEVTVNYHGVAPEPLSLRIHRLDLMLVGVSHDEGISIIDVDRLLAELGAGERVDAPLEYAVAGCEAIAEETVRILEDYGFLDDRPLFAQVGAQAGAS